MRNRQHGLLGFGLTGYVALGCVAALLIAAGVIRWQQSRLEAVKQEYAAFVAEVKAKGEAAEREALRINKENDAKKAKYDKQISDLRIANAAINKRLLDSAGRSSLPETRTVTGQPDGTACFKRGILDESLRAFTAGTAAIATECQSAVDSLNNARQWAAER